MVVKISISYIYRTSDFLYLNYNRGAWLLIESDRTRLITSTLYCNQIQKVTSTVNDLWNGTMKLINHVVLSFYYKPFQKVQCVITGQSVNEKTWTINCIGLGHWSILFFGTFRFINSPYRIFFLLGHSFGHFRIEVSKDCFSPVMIRNVSVPDANNVHCFTIFAFAFSLFLAWHICCFLCKECLNKLTIFT